MTTQSINKRSILAAARRKWGPTAHVVDLGRRTTPDEREAARQRRSELAAQIEQLRTVVTSQRFREIVTQMAHAADFYRATHAAEAATRLATALTAYESYLDDELDLRRARQERDRLVKVTHRYRYEILSYSQLAGRLTISTSQAVADTLAELQAKIDADLG